jgi:hypothetical protein
MSGNELEKCPKEEKKETKTSMKSKNFDKSVSEKWNDFRKTGLFQFVNSVLHLFGYAIYVVLDESGAVISAYPDKCNFRGFDGDSTTEMYYRIGKYMKENAAKDLDNAFCAEEQKIFEAGLE